MHSRRGGQVLLSLGLRLAGIELRDTTVARGPLIELHRPDPRRGVGGHLQLALRVEDGASIDSQAHHGQHDEHQQHAGQRECLTVLTPA